MPYVIDVSQELEDIRLTPYGKTMRPALHSSIYKLSQKQNQMAGVFDQLIINAGNSNAEVVAARVDKDGNQFAQLTDRLNNNEEEVEILEGGFNALRDEVVDARTDKRGVQFNLLEGRLNNTDTIIDNIAYDIFVNNDNPLTDNSTSIQTQINDGVGKGYSSFILRPSNKNSHIYIEKTIMLPSNVIIDGSGITIKAKNYTDIGKYTTCIFKSDNTSNIKIKNVTLDANCTLGGFVNVTDKTKISNLVAFDNCTNLIFEDVKFINFISNPCTTNAKHYEWALGGFNQCKSVKILDCKLTQCDTEGLDFYKCTNVEVNRFYSENSEMTTPLHFWYCNGVRLLNSEIYEDVGKTNAGSTINCCSSNVLINGNKITGGTSLDIGNESDEDFTAENITISNNYLKTAINAIVDSNLKFLNKNVRVINNHIDATGYNYGINLGEVENAIVQGNVIVGVNAAYRCFNTSQKNVIIENNTFENVRQGVALNIVKNIDGVYIRNNIINTMPLGNNNPLNNNSVCVAISGSDPAPKCKNIYITDNICNSEGALLMMHQVTDGYVENIFIKNNVLTSDTICKRSIRVRKAKNVEIIGNKLMAVDGLIGNRITEVENIKIENNEVIVPNNTTFHPWQLDANCKGVVTFHNNTYHGDSLRHHVRIDEPNPGDAQSTFYTYASPTNYPDVYSGDFKPYFRGTTQQRPTYSLKIGQNYFDTTLNKLIIYDGANWRDSQGVIV